MIVTGPDGNLWFTESPGAKIGRMTPAGALAEFQLPAGANPGGITVGPEGNLWFTDNGRNKIGTHHPRRNNHLPRRRARGLRHRRHRGRRRRKPVVHGERVREGGAGEVVRREVSFVLMLVHESRSSTWAHSCLSTAPKALARLHLGHCIASGKYTNCLANGITGRAGPSVTNIQTSSLESVASRRA